MGFGSDGGKEPKLRSLAQFSGKRDSDDFSERLCVYFYPARVVSLCVCSVLFCLHTHRGAALNEFSARRSE